MARDVSDDTKKTLGETIRQLRQDRLWSQAELAHLIGTTPVSVGRWEKNLTRPSLHFQQQLCEVFGKSPRELGFVPQAEHEEDSQSTGQLQQAGPDCPEQSLIHQRATHTLPLLVSVSPASLPHARNTAFWQRRNLLFVMTCLSLFLLFSMLFWYARQDVLSSTSHPSSCQTPSSYESPATIYTQVLCHHAQFSSALNRQDELQWDENEQCSFQQGAYHVLLPPTEYVAECFAHAASFGPNFALQVDITILKGYSGGLVFRAEGPSSNWDVINSRIPIDIWGQYNFYLASTNESCHLTKDPIAPTYCHSPHGTITYGTGVTNTMTVVALGPQVYLYVNGFFIDHTQVPNSSALTGFVGVFANGSHSPGDVAFRHFQAWNL